MNNELICSVIMIVSVLISSISQIGLKIAAEKKYNNRIQEYMNPWVIGSYILFFGSTLLTVFALRGISVSRSMILESAGYIFVSFFSFIFLKEKFPIKKLLGIALILIGIVIYTL